MKYNFCPECGAKLERVSKFCPTCGVKLDDATKSVSDDELESAIKLFTGNESDVELIPVFKKYTDAGRVEAQFYLALCYMSTGSKEDAEKSDELIKDAAERGYADAQYQLAMNYEFDDDYDNALYWYRKAAENGDAAAKRELELLKEKLGKK